MKCLRCKSRGESNPPDYILRQQQGVKEVYMICPKCGHVKGSIGNSKRR